MLPIFLGGMIYIAFRTETLLMFRWFKMIKLTTFITSIRDFTQPLYSFLPNWFIFSLPDGLWIYSVVFFYTIIWKDENIRFLIFWLCICFIFSIGSEIGQFFNIVSGTFSWVDLVFYLSGFYSAIFIVLTKERIRHENKKIFIT